MCAAPASPFIPWEVVRNALPELGRSWGFSEDVVAQALQAVASDESRSHSSWEQHFVNACLDLKGGSCLLSTVHLDCGLLCSKVVTLPLQVMQHHEVMTAQQQADAGARQHVAGMW
jgi:hypothetical protein